MTIPVPHDETREKNQGHTTSRHAMVEATLRQARADVFEQHVWSAEQELAVAVFAQAVRDVRDTHLSPPVRAAAATFLLDHTEMFRFWIAVARLDGELVQEYARHWIGREPNGLKHARTDAA